MDEQRLGRALSWAGTGGTTMAAATLAVAGLLAVTPDGSQMSSVVPCAWSGCTPPATAVGTDGINAVTTAAVVPRAVPAGGVTVTVPSSPPAANVLPSMQMVLPGSHPALSPVTAPMLPAGPPPPAPAKPAKPAKPATHRKPARRAARAVKAVKAVRAVKAVKARPKAAPRAVKAAPVQPAVVVDRRFWATVVPSPASGVGMSGYGTGNTGFDISRYQCGALPWMHPKVSVVQVTGGTIDSANPCYRQEAGWAGDRLSAYIYLNGVPARFPGYARRGPGGDCRPSNVPCQSVNYGWYLARHWVAWAGAQQTVPRMWWLDVEKFSGWTSPGINSLVIRGALLGLHSMGVQEGIYSSAPQWSDITGGMAVPGVAEWVPGAGQEHGAGYTAQAFCADPASYTFGGGKLAMVQFGYTGPFAGSYPTTTTFDLDYSC
jgi:hypothetical protein